MVSANLVVTLALLPAIVVAASSSSNEQGSITTASPSSENPFASYPLVAHTASINGFADKIYADLPQCAKACVLIDASSLPCPYWDTGCLCVWQSWSNQVAECIAENCRGDDVEVARSLATSECSSAGLDAPYWFLGESYLTLLESAEEAAYLTTDEASVTSLAEALVSASASLTLIPETSSAETSSDNDSASKVTETSAPSSSSSENPFASYPLVAHTASINGFADKIYADLPQCAKACVLIDASSLPCPYWDTGCLCVWQSWSNQVAECIAENCRGDDVEVARSLATSECSAAGLDAPYWFLGESYLTLLESAEEAAYLTTDEASVTSLAEALVSASASLTLVPETSSTQSGIETNSSEIISSSTVSSNEASSNVESSYSHSTWSNLSTTSGIQSSLYSKSEIVSETSASLPIVTESSDSSLTRSSYDNSTSSEAETTTRIGLITSESKQKDAFTSEHEQTVTDTHTTLETIYSCKDHHCLIISTESQSQYPSKTTSHKPLHSSKATNLVDTVTKTHTSTNTLYSCDENQTEVPSEVTSQTGKTSPTGKQSTLSADKSFTKGHSLKLSSSGKVIYSTSLQGDEEDEALTTTTISRRTTVTAQSQSGVSHIYESTSQASTFNSKTVSEYEGTAVKQGISFILSFLGLFFFL